MGKIETSPDGRVAAIVPAAGASRRIGGRTPKPFLTVHGKPLLAHTLGVLQSSPAVRWIVLVVREQERAAARALLSRYRISKALEPCVGGASRAASVMSGFRSVPAQADFVLVHDGARPCVTRRLVDDAIQAARRHGAVACGIPASVTVKAVDEQRAVRLTLDRDHLWFVQTPQVFRRAWFAQAFVQADHRLDRFPDDAAIVEAAGFSVRMVPGDPLNLKVTTKDDLILAEAILSHRSSQPSAISSQRKARRVRKQPLEIGLS